MANPYIPRADARALAWMRGFARGLVDALEAYFVSPAEAESVRQTVEQFGQALDIARSPLTRTPSAVCRKDQMRNAAESFIAVYYNLIKHNHGISDADKIAIGVRPLNRSRIPIRCPQTSPVVDVIACTPGRQTLRYHDSLTPESRGKPFGAVGLQLFVAIADEPVRDPERAKLVGTYTRNPVEVAFRNADGGKRASYFGRWISRRGETGPWSLPKHMHIAA